MRGRLLPYMFSLLSGEDLFWSNEFKVISRLRDSKEAFLLTVCFTALVLLKGFNEHMDQPALEPLGSFLQLLCNVYSLL